MKLMHPMFSSPLCLRENSVQTLVVENPAAFRKLAAELVGQAEGYEGEFILSANDHVLDCSGHLNVFYDFFHLQEMEKRLQTKALSALLKNTQENLAQENFQLFQAIQTYLGKLAAQAEFPVAYETAENLSALLKAWDFHVDFSDLPAAEALYEHMALINGLLKNQCFVLIHAHAFFSMEELNQLISMAHYRKIPLFLLESHAYAPLETEKIRLYDADLCELTLEERRESV